MEYTTEGPVDPERQDEMQLPLADDGCCCCGVEIVDDGTNDWYFCDDCTSETCPDCGLCANCCECDGWRRVLHRFHEGRVADSQQHPKDSEGEMGKFAYADPPYVGQAKRHYQCEEIDHVALIKRLVDEFPDGWALSCSTPSLREILPLCPDDVRVAAWVKPFAFFKGGVKPPFAWEPVIWRTVRKKEKRAFGVRDWLSCNAFGVTKAEREMHGRESSQRSSACGCFSS